MKKYKALTCEFITKSYKKENGKSPKLFFKAYFLFDDNLNIYKEFIQIKKNENYNIATYRHTDIRIIETEKNNGYYKNKKVKEFRKNFLDINDINSNTYDYAKENLINLTDEKISEINKAFLSNENYTKTTAKTMISYLTGSNPTGCELHWRSNPFIVVNNLNKFDGCNLMNVITNYRKQTKSFRNNKCNDLIDLKQIEEYSIEEFSQKSTLFNQIFNSINDEFFKINDELSNWKWSGENIELKEKQKHASSFKNMDEYYEFVKTLLVAGRINLNELTEKEIAQVLLKYFNYACDLSKYFKVYDDIFSVINDGGAKPERAHIIGRKKTLLPWILKTKDINEKNKIFLLGIKHLNCLYMSPNLHSNYDENIVTINPKNGMVLDIKKDCCFNDCWIKEKELKDKQKYLQINWEHFLKTKENL